MKSHRNGFIDRTGKKYGKITVMGYSHSSKGCGHRTVTHWIGHCECGSEGIFSGPNMGRGNTKTCGCSKIERCKDTKTMNKAWGERVGSSRLTVDQVIEIRERYFAGYCTQRELAERYDVSQGTIQGIVTGRRWKKAGGPITNGGVVSQREPIRKRRRLSRRQNGPSM